jgi:hypothetical protein
LIKEYLNLIPIMKRIALASFFLLLVSLNSSGQWYQKKYQVSDINALSLDQLQESLKESKNDALISSGIAVLGGLCILSGIYIPYEINDESTLFEQIMGPKGMNYLLIGIGALFAAGGTISAFNFLGRTVSIKNTMNRNYPVTRSLNISPEIMFNKYCRTSCAGVSLTINF